MHSGEQQGQPIRCNAWFVRVRPVSARHDGHGRDVLADIRRAGFDHIEAVTSSKVYILAGNLTEADLRLLAGGLLADPVADVFEFGPATSRGSSHAPAIEVHLKPGVMNSTATTARNAAQRLLTSRNTPGERLQEIRTARRYEILGANNADELDAIANRVLANGCIETYYIQGLGRNDTMPVHRTEPPAPPPELQHVCLEGLGDLELAHRSRRSHLFLSVEEMRAIRDHFAPLGRDPTDLELETLAQTWSEHCVHKTFKSSIDYRGEDFGKPGSVRVHFDNLLKETIAAATVTLNRDWCLSVFVDNAGVIAFDEAYGLAFKAETHNHPSAIEPYGGASTGIGGCIRDIMGCGLGAKPIASTDVFCVAPPDYDAVRLPRDVLHPRRILKGVVAGVRDYGNRMGIPTVNGAVYFDERYLANPLVFCGCVGLIPRNRIDKQPHAGDCIVVAGGRTGRDGVHGATFSSAELTDTHASEFSHAVQIGNAIEEKKVLDAMLLARDHPEGCLYSAVTDCGAGGLSSAVGEMGAELGAVVNLEKVPLKYTGLRYDEIWISEAQERMVFAVPPQRLDSFLTLFAAEEVEATVIGTFTGDGVLRVRHNGTTVGELSMKFLHHGMPRTTRTAVWSVPSTPPASCADVASSEPGNERLLGALGALNTASKEWIIRQYDHEVQGRSVIKPLVGPGFGPSDAAVLRPRYEYDRGIALGCGLCPERFDVDPYWMAVASVDEALRNVVCVGANPDRTAILDNFCWPKVDSEKALGGLVRACCGAADAAVAFGLPFVSGKDSLNNEYTMSEADARRLGKGSRIAIPGTLLISALGIIDDVRRCVSMDLKEASDCLVIATAPANRVGLEAAKSMHDRVSELVRGGQVRSAHDVSDGGLVVAIAEMCIASGLGATVRLDRDAYGESLFASTLTTYVLEMSEAAAQNAALPVIGHVKLEPRLLMDGGVTIDLAVSELADAWRSPLARGGGG